MIRESTESGKIIEIPPSFGTYQYVRTIGTGNYSVVILVTSIETLSQYACKVVARSDLEDPGARLRFEKEVQILQSVRHKNIIEIQEVLYTDTNVYMIMEYCPNGELFFYVINYPNLMYEEIQKFFFQVVSAIYFLHSHKIAHRDIKPENILLDSNLNVKLADFGFSRESSTETLLQTPCGSPFYAAPEIITGQSYDGQKSDIWSLGIVLFGLATHALPWTATNQTALYYQVSNAQYEIPAFVPSDIASCIAICLKVLPEERPTAYELLQSDFLCKLSYGIPKVNVPPNNYITRENNPKIVSNSMVLQHSPKTIHTVFQPPATRSGVLGSKLRKVGNQGIKHRKPKFTPKVQLEPMETIEDKNI